MTTTVEILSSGGRVICLGFAGFDFLLSSLICRAALAIERGPSSQRAFCSSIANLQMSSAAETVTAPCLTLASSSGAPSLTTLHAEETDLGLTAISLDASSTARGDPGTVLSSPTDFSEENSAAIRALWATVSCRRYRLSDKTCASASSPVYSSNRGSMPSSTQLRYRFRPSRIFPSYRRIGVFWPRSLMLSLRAAKSSPAIRGKSSE